MNVSLIRGSVPLLAAVTVGTAATHPATTLAALPVPETCVLDGALVEGRGWCLLEANAFGAPG